MGHRIELAYFASDLVDRDWPDVTKRKTAGIKKTAGIHYTTKSNKSPVPRIRLDNVAVGTGSIFTCQRIWPLNRVDRDCVTVGSPNQTGALTTVCVLFRFRVPGCRGRYCFRPVCSPCRSGKSWVPLRSPIDGPANCFRHCPVREAESMSCRDGF